MVFEAAARLLGYEGPKLTPNEYGIQFMDSMLSHLTAVNQNRPDLQELHLDSKNQRPLLCAFPNQNIREYSWQPHRIWINGDYNNLENEIHCAVAARYTNSGERVVCNFQSGTMRQRDDTYFLILDRNGNSDVTTTYIRLSMGIGDPGQNIHKLTSVETRECIKLMQKMENAHDKDIDSSYYSGKGSIWPNLLELSNTVELALKGHRGVLGLCQEDRKFVEYVSNKS